jgi:pimeloyl-ACP methyl ester carboxylesterase
VSPALPLHVTDIPWSGGKGDERTPTFLLLHGFGGSSFTWHMWAPALSRRGRVVLVDMKGFGKAPKPDDGRYAPADLAQNITELILQLDLDRLTLVGHSLGGGVALFTALALLDLGEERLERLVLIGAAAYRQRLPPFVGLSQRPRFSAFMIRLMGPSRLIRFVLRSIVHDRERISQDQIEAYAAPLRTAEGIRALLEVGHQILPEDIDEISTRYPELEVPVLLLWGRQDPVIPLSIAHRLHEEMPDTRLEILESCGHIPPEELPERSFAVLASFLDDTDRADPESA